MFAGNIEKAISDMKSGVYDFTINGECSRCGNCCSNYLPMSEKEIKSIRKYITKNNVKEVVRCMPLSDPTFDLTCPFYSEVEKACRIYEVRPAICRDFKCDKPKQQIMATKNMYHSRMKVVNMRNTFYGHGAEFDFLMRGSLRDE